MNFIKELLPLNLRRRLGLLKRALRDPLPEDEMVVALKRLRSLGFQPRTCIDVGAYRGDWTTLFLSIFPRSHILMIEAQDSKKDELEKVVKSHPQNVDLQIGLLGAEEGREVEFHNMETGSSVFVEQSPYSRTTAKKIQRTLDGIAVPLPKFSGKIDFLKLDVQGYELEILKGAVRVLSSCEMVLMEASLIPVNTGCPLFHEVVAFMNARGFILLDFAGFGRRMDESLWQIDLLFISKESRHVPVSALTSANWALPPEMVAVGKDAK